MRARVSSRQSLRLAFRWLLSREEVFPLAPVFVGDLDLVADLPGLLARNVPVAFGFEGKDFSTVDFGDFICFRFSK
jgi:hypothetical protein